MGRTIYGWGYGVGGPLLVLGAVCLISVAFAQAPVPRQPAPQRTRPEPFLPRDVDKGEKQPPQLPPAKSDDKAASSLKTQFMRGFYEAIENLSGKEIESKDKDRLKDEIRAADELYDKIRTANREAIREVNRQQQYQHIHARNIILITATGMGYGDVGADHPKPPAPEPPADGEKKPDATDQTNSRQPLESNVTFTQAVAQPSPVGPPRIQTPVLDALAASGLRFTNFYASGKGDEASRWKLLRGLVTGNRTTHTFDPDDLTLADILWRGGYSTGMIGNCYLGPIDKRFVAPSEIGFEHYLGFLDKRLLTEHYPATLWLNDRQATIPGNQNGLRQNHVQQLFTEGTKAYITANRAGRPFFLYLPYTTPRENWEVPYRADYAGATWPNQQQTYAATISRIDRDVGEIRDHLERLGMLGRTTIIFTTDAKRVDLAGVERNFFESDGPPVGVFQRIEPGTRSPLIIYNARGASAGHVVDRECDFTDLATTILDLARVFPRPTNLPGKTLADTFVAPVPITPPAPATAPNPATPPIVPGAGKTTATKFEDT